MPGTMNLEVVPLLESKLGTRLSQVKLFYSPEFIALGSVIKNLQYPDAILIGEANVGSAPLLTKVLEKTVKNSPEVTILNLVNAEIAKISVNAYVTMKISFANQLSEICQALPFGDADEVLNAIAKDSRIGAKYLHSAPAFGGPCFPRDNRAFSKLASDLGIDANLSKGTDQINLRQVDRLIEQIKELSLDFKSVVILGVSYKPGTKVFEESPSLRFFELLHEETQVEKVSMYDPAFLDPESRISLKSIGNSIISEVSELKIALNEADAVYLFNNDDAFLDIPELIYSNETNLFDLWGSWVTYRDTFHGRYYRLGKSTITRWKD
jgi:UDPglucose 6-dehydrogenase